MAQIDVLPVAEDQGWTFEVTVSEAGSRTTHRVRMTRDDYERLAGGACPPDELVRTSFEFLLEREPKESILRAFDVTVISSYFPEYEREIKDRIRQQR